MYSFIVFVCLIQFNYNIGVQKVFSHLPININIHKKNYNPFGQKYYENYVKNLN